MGKSESTAVNALIDMVRSGAPAASDAGDDLFAAHPPRMTSTLPPAAAEVAPLPRMRAPTGTSQHTVDKQGQIRVTTAPPARQNTIPPLPQARGSKAPPLPSRASRPSPAPRPSQEQQAVPPPRPSQAQQAVPPPRPSTQAAAPRAAQQMPAQQRASQPMPAVRAPAPEVPQRARAASPSPDMLAAAAAQRAKSPDPGAPRKSPSGTQRAQSPDLGAQRRSPSGTQRAQSPDAPRAAATDVARAATLPAPKRQTGNQRATGAQRTTPPRTSPVAAPFEAPHPMMAIAEQYRMSTIDQTGDAVNAENWFEASRAVEKIDETWVGTRPAERRASPGATAKRVLVPLVALAVVGFGVGYLVFHSAAANKKTAPKTAHVTAPAAAPASPPKVDQLAVATPSTESANAATATAGGSQPEPPPPSAAPVDPNLPTHANANEVKIVSHASTETPAAAPAPAPVAAPAPPPAPAPSSDPVAPAGVKAIADSSPVVQEVRTSHGVIKLVDVRIDSKPSGATVMLVDNGKTTLLGTTPVAASVDPSRAYDVVLTLDSRPAQMTHFDPAKTQRLDVTLAKGAPLAKAAPAVKAPAPSRSETPHRSAAKKAAPASAPAGGLADPGFDEPKAETPKAADKSEGGNGTLMVSSKPPCEIFIDGTDSGLKTPQRAMSLPAGTHKVTFSNPDANITKTVSVKITADQTTKLIQNLMGE